MKIGDRPKLPSLPATLDEAAKAAAKSVKNLPGVAKTPTPGGAVPTPYPNAGDSFERVETSKVGKLLQSQASIQQTEAKIDTERDAAWTSFALTAAAAAAAFGMSAADGASWAGSAAQAAAAASLLGTGLGAAPAGGAAPGAEAADKGAGPATAPAGTAADGAAGAGAAGAGAAGAVAAASGAATGAAGAAAAAGGAAAAAAVADGGAAAGAAAAGAAGGRAAGGAAGGAAAAGAAAASSAVVSALVAGAAAGAAAGGAAVSSGAAAAAQGALQALTEAAVQGGANEGLASRWSQFVGELSSGGGAIDPNALVQAVLRESYLQTTEDLRFYAEKVKHFNEQKQTIRDHLQKLRDYDTSAGAAGGTEETGQSDTQETMRLFQETVDLASNLNRKFSETAQAIIDNLKA